MNLDRLYEILRECTVQLRKGDVRTERPGVVVIDAMPHHTEADSALERVDLHFVVVGVDKAKAEARKAELIGILKEYPRPERMAAGPSYIEFGGVIGDQGAALSLFALGKVLGLWTLITPESVGLTGTKADEAAGLGLIMCTGFRGVLQ